jgi:hypothetical protein
VVVLPNIIFDVSGAENVMQVGMWFEFYSK